MKVLGIECSSLTASVAVSIDGEMAAEYTLNQKKTHSQTILPMIDQMLGLLEMEADELDGIAVAAGPGSFTGLRIGAATAKGIGLVIRKPLIHVPTMDAMAYGLFGAEGILCPMLDARRGNVYTGIYEYRDSFRVLKKQCLISVKDLIAELNESAEGKRVVFFGDGADANRGLIEETVKVPYIFAAAPSNRQRASSVAVLGEKLLQEGKTVSAADFAPDYLRKSQAERERDVAEKLGVMDQLAAGIVVRNPDGTDA
ncbi:MAG: tRNA (adenosine(37)-N6)-threonylcarbamoyltransferase complex dimerization subunit type 1 TsaB [Bacillota bacterium]|nr:tRNA (adenosine(37)-N6)-threonylcarbamoyltransferase complex dimerization subunit type 1 TsaB [Bacillota bacterium]